MPSLELYIQHITFFVSGHWFVPHNKLIHRIYNIGTATHLLLTKAPSSEFQECFGKVILPLNFIQLHPIVILLWNEWFFWIQTIWVWNVKNSLFLFFGFILPHTYPIIWLIWLCHLCYLGIASFLQSNYILTPLHVAFYWDIGRTACYQACWFCQLSLVIWTLDGGFQHQSLLTAFIYNREDASCRQLLISWDCCHLSSFLQIISKCHS